MKARGGKNNNVQLIWPNGSFWRTNGENPKSSPPSTWPGTNVVTFRAATKKHQPERAGARVSRMLNEAMGPNSQVIGAITMLGTIHEVLVIMLAPPWPANMALDKKGECPWISAHGVQVRNHNSWLGSPHWQVIVEVGLPVIHTCHHSRTPRSVKPPMTARWSASTRRLMRALRGVSRAGISGLGGGGTVATPVICDSITTMYCPTNGSRPGARARGPARHVACRFAVASKLQSWTTWGDGVMGIEMSGAISVLSCRSRFPRAHPLANRTQWGPG